MADKFQLKALITGVDRLSPMLKGVQRNAQSLRKNLEKSGLGNMDLGGALTGAALAAPFIGGVRAAMTFESKMADVKKVVDFDTPADFAQMGKDVLALSRELPMAADGIAQIVAAGGQAGIPRKELLGFAQDAVKMGVAFDQTAEQAGEMMATWRTSYKMGQAQVVELADKINYLGNTGPANAQKISGIVTEVGALGQVAGLNTGQVAALGATMAGVGVKQDVAATGIKNFMLAMTKGTAATKGQQEAFKSIRLDAVKVSKSMQVDAQGTILDLLQRISKVRPDAQASLITEIFGSESISAIAPLLTNLGLLTANFSKVGDASLYAGSMGKEYAERAKTTEANLQRLKNRSVELGIAVGNILLPPFNDLMGVLGPMATGMADLVSANPWMVKALLGAAGGFLVLKLGVMGATLALKALLAAGSLTPLGLAVRLLALGAGMVIANWGAVSTWFAGFGRRLGIIARFIGGGLKAMFDWSVKGLLDKVWGPVVDWFKDMWERIKPYVQPVLDGAKVVADVAGKLFGGGQQASPAQTEAGANARRTGWVASDRSLAGTDRNLVQQTTEAQKAQVGGEVRVRFDNAPPGMQVEPAKTDTPGVEIKPFVGYRTLSRRPAQ